MKWKPLEPTQGQFITAIPDAMIAWAQGHNIRYRGSSSNNNNSSSSNNMIQCGATVCSRPSRGTTLGGCGGSSAVYRHLDQTLATAGQ